MNTTNYVSVYMDRDSINKELLEKRIAGEIVLSDDAGKVIQKWRNIFKIPQRKLADEMHIMPSVISDYENGRRKSPGIKMIKKIVDSLIEIDERRGGKINKEFTNFPSRSILPDAILGIKEFGTPVSIKDFCKTINASVVVGDGVEDRKIYGYTVVDSMKAIMDIPPMELVKLYGLTSERALIFIGAHRGRSSMVAIKVTNLRPGLIILHGSEEADDLAKRIALLENIPLAITKIKSTEEILTTLKKKYS